MKSRLVLSALVFLWMLETSLALEQEAPTICISPSGTCYAGSQLVSDQGTQYYSFQGVRSVLLPGS